MALTWRGQRQILYYSVFGVIALGLLFVLYQTFFSIEASCRNGQEDPGEYGVDCGGVCALICPGDARAPVVLWARTFKVSQGTYTAAAYIQNNNVGAGARGVSYTFQLFDENNELVVERRGKTDIPPTHIAPILETGIQTGTRDAVRALFAFTGEPVWERATKELPDLKIKNQKLEQGGGRLTATLVNESRTTARVQVVAVLFNNAGAALAASKSAVTVGPRGDEFIVFTFSPAPPGVTRAEITVLPPF